MTDTYLYCKIERNQRIWINGSFSNDTLPGRRDKWKKQASESVERFDIDVNENQLFIVFVIYKVNIEYLLHIDTVPYISKNVQIPNEVEFDNLTWMRINVAQLASIIVDLLCLVFSNLKNLTSLLDH